MAEYIPKETDPVPKSITSLTDVKGTPAPNDVIVYDGENWQITCNCGLYESSELTDVGTGTEGQHLEINSGNWSGGDQNDPKPLEPGWEEIRIDNVGADALLDKETIMKALQHVSSSVWTRQTKAFQGTPLSTPVEFGIQEPLTVTTLQGNPSLASRPAATNALRSHLSLGAVGNQNQYRINVLRFRPGTVIFDADITINIISSSNADYIIEVNLAPVDDTPKWTRIVRVPGGNYNLHRTFLYVVDNTTTSTLLLEYRLYVAGGGIFDTSYFVSSIKTRAEFIPFNTLDDGTSALRYRINF